MRGTATNEAEAVFRRRRRDVQVAPEARDGAHDGDAVGSLHQVQGGERQHALVVKIVSSGLN